MTVTGSATGTSPLTALANPVTTAPGQSGSGAHDALEGATVIHTLYIPKTQTSTDGTYSSDWDMFTEYQPTHDVDTCSRCHRSDADGLGLDSAGVCFGCREDEYCMDCAAGDLPYEPEDDTMLRTDHLDYPFCEVCQAHHEPDPFESCLVGLQVQVDRQTSNVTALHAHRLAVAVLPKGSYVPTFEDRCRVVRASSYARQQARNERFEHLRRLLCKPEPVEARPSFQAGIRPSWVEFPRTGYGPVWTEGDTPDAYTVRERERLSEVNLGPEWAGDDDDILVIDHDEEWHNERSAFTNGEQVQAEADDYQRWHDVRLRDLAAGFEIQRRERGQITTNCKTRWVTYTSSQAKCRVTANTTTGYLRLMWGKLEIRKEKVSKHIIEHRNLWAEQAERWLRENGHEPNVAVAVTQHTSNPIQATATLRDKLYLEGIQVNVKIMGR